MVTPSVTMTQTFHNRQLSTFFDGCETLFSQLVGEMVQRGEVDVKNVPLGYLTVDVNFGAGLKASSTMSVCDFQSTSHNITHLQILRPPSRLMSSFATDMNDMFDHLVCYLKSTSEMPSGASMALLVTKVTVGTHVFNTTLSIDLGTVAIVPVLQPRSHPSGGNGMLTMPSSTSDIDDDEDGELDLDSISVGPLDRDNRD